MKNYYVAEFQVLVDGKNYSVEVVAGQGYNPNTAKGVAEGRVRKDNPGKQVAAILLKKTDMNLEEYKAAMGGTPGWLGGPQADQ